MATESEKRFSRAKQIIPGGVNSPVRAFNAVGGHPLFIDKGLGAYLWDIDGAKYVDYVASYGPIIVGHAHPAVVEAVCRAAKKGLSYGAPTEYEIELVEIIQRHMPAIEKVRMVNSGTEATMSAIRLARGFTGRDKVIKFEGCYHGHADGLLVKAGSGALTLGVPTSPGVPSSVAEHTITLEYNNLGQVQEVFSQMGDQIAALIVEPVAGNMSCVLPKKDFLHGLRDLCTKSGAVLIFDEVMTGFRVALNGAQGVYDVQPDLSTLGKIVGGGMPVGAFGGRNDIMDCLAPVGAVYQAGTLSGNPLAMVAGIETLKLVSAPGFYDSLQEKTEKLMQGLKSVAASNDVPLVTQGIGGMFGLFFSDQPEITTFHDVMRCDTEKFTRFFHAMLNRGVYFAPSAFETAFVSSAHSDANIDATIEKAEAVFKQLTI